MKVTYVTHPDVVKNPDLPVPQWPLSDKGKARMTLMLEKHWIESISAVWCSKEQKALDGAAILGSHLGLQFSVHAGLGENDRSTTGYMAHEAFLTMRDRFFNEPEANVEGWESAVDAQARIVATVKSIVAEHTNETHIAFVAHGGVGALLLASVMSEEISLQWDQPADDEKVGGNYFVFETDTWSVLQGWKPIDD